jgi:hypothetical protein
MCHGFGRELSPVALPNVMQHAVVATLRQLGAAAVPGHNTGHA